MNRFQKKILKVYIEFKKICDDNNIRYFAYGGTAIGVLRHHGFIPWDDDIDILMPYPDCLKLMDIIEKAKPKLSIEMSERSFINGSDQNLFKVFSKNNTFAGATVNSPEDFIGIFVDVFPLIGLPDDDTERENFCKEIIKLRKEIYYDIPFTVSDNIDNIEKLQKLFAKYDYEKSVIVATPMLDEGDRQFSKDDFIDPIEMKFENTKMWVSKNNDSQLKEEYGDYMKLPPKSARIAGHASKAFVDLDKPYSYYIKEINKSSIKNYIDYINGEAIRLKRELSTKSKKIISLNLENESLKQPSIRQSITYIKKAIRRRIIK